MAVPIGVENLQHDGDERPAESELGAGQRFYSQPTEEILAAMAA